MRQITTDDLRRYLTNYQVQRRSSKVTIDNIRRILSSFFSWLEDEDFIVKSPVRRIHKVKTAKVVKDTYTDEVLELMRDNCTTARDLAMIDLLASSGMRVGELVTLNREDINFNERECVVIGKGNKERLFYFDARTKIHLQNYLEAVSYTHLTDDCKEDGDDRHGELRCVCKEDADRRLHHCCGLHGAEKARRRNQQDRCEHQYLSLIHI